MYQIGEKGKRIHMISKLLIFSESMDSNLSRDMLLRTGLANMAPIFKLLQTVLDTCAVFGINPY
jgi:hypothetical protein